MIAGAAVRRGLLAPMYAAAWCCCWWCPCTGCTLGHSHGYHLSIAMLAPPMPMLVPPMPMWSPSHYHGDYRSLQCWLLPCQCPPPPFSWNSSPIARVAPPMPMAGTPFSIAMLPTLWGAGEGVRRWCPPDPPDPLTLNPPDPTHVLAFPCGQQGLPASALSIAHLLDTRQAGGWVVVC